MSFLKNLFGKWKQSPAQTQARPEGKLATGKEDMQVYAVALVTDLWMMFDSDETQNNWVAKVLYAKWEGVKLPPKAQIEVEVGFKGSDNEAKTKLGQMLQQAVATANLEPHKYEKEFFSVHSEAPIPTKVWCMTAVKPQIQKGTDDIARFVGTLDDHLQRMKAAAPQLAPFLDQYFSDTIVAAIAPTAVEKMRLTQSDGKQHSSILAREAVVYHISTLPVDMDKAKDWFLSSSGSYTKLLERAQNSMMSQGTDCSVWCHIIYGWSKKGSWVHMAIIPVKQSAPINVRIWPIEFLTSDERQTLGL